MRASTATRLFRAGRSCGLARRLSTYPPHELVGMPSLSPTMTAGTVGSWGKKVGDKCSPGESVAEIETDKASMAYEAQDEFFIAKLLIEAGVEVPVGSPMMVTVEDESFVAAFANYVPPSSASAPATPTTPPVAAAPAPVIEKVIPPPVVAAPVVVPVAAPAPKAVPVIATPTPSPPTAVAAATTTILNGVYSVKWSTGAVASSPIAARLSKDQQAYILKFGRAAQKPLKI